MSDTFTIAKPSFDAETRTARFSYQLGALSFAETVTFPAGNAAERARTPAFLRLLELTAVVLGVSYFKLLAPEQVVASFPLTTRGRELATDVYTNGLGEFYARNGLLHFDRLRISAPDADEQPEAVELGDRVLLPIGGGKDSLVSVQLLERAGIDFSPFAVNPKGPIIGSVDAIHRPPIFVKRQLDPEMLRLSKLPPYLNGHVPSTAINSMIAALATVLFSYGQIALSNERSASEGNAIHDGREVNHQHSKSIAFERLIAASLAEATGGALGYFSLLRPYSEARIAGLFARETRFDHVFSSCNRNFRLSGHDGPLWCGECPKCHFTFLMLAPVTPKQRVMGIFGANFLDRAANEASFRELTGLAGQKPWECVGEIEEAAACLYALAKRPDWADDLLVSRLKPDLLRQYGEARLETALVDLAKDSAEHLIPAAIADKVAAYAV